MQSILKSAAVAALTLLFGVEAIDTKKALAYSYNATHTDDVAGTAKVGSNGWVMYKQCDGAWANQQLGYCDLTICSAGCAMSSVGNACYYSFNVIQKLFFIYHFV